MCQKEVRPQFPRSESADAPEAGKSCQGPATSKYSGSTSTRAVCRALLSRAPCICVRSLALIHRRPPLPHTHAGACPAAVCALAHHCVRAPSDGPTLAQPLTDLSQSATCGTVCVLKPLARPLPSSFERSTSIFAWVGGSTCAYADHCTLYMLNRPRPPPPPHRHPP